jgi:hypothetical protein
MFMTNLVLKMTCNCFQNHSLLLASKSFCRVLQMSDVPKFLLMQASEKENLSFNRETLFSLLSYFVNFHVQKFCSGFIVYEIFGAQKMRHRRVTRHQQDQIWYATMHDMAFFKTNAVAYEQINNK